MLGQEVSIKLVAIQTDHLVWILQTIKTTVETGELDQQIESASAVLRTGFKR